MLVTVGTAILIVYILFFHKEDEKTAEVVDGDEKK
jgi:hypothetical protein